MTKEPNSLHQKIVCIMQWKNMILKNNTCIWQKMEWMKITVSEKLYFGKWFSKDREMGREIQRWGNAGRIMGIKKDEISVNSCIKEHALPILLSKLENWIY